MNSYATRLINRLVFNLYPSELPIPICHQIKWGMLRYWVQNYEPLLEHIELSLQNTQIAFILGMVHGRHTSQDQWMGQPKVSSGLPSALPVKVSPIQCGSLYGFTFPIKAPICVLYNVHT